MSDPAVPTESFSNLCMKDGDGAPAAKEPPKSFMKRDHLRELEVRIQKKWEEEKVYERQAEFDETGKPTPKYLVTFPYPYMNGRLHLGHAFSMTKAEFAARFQRLLGKNALFPFGFHCTGMPIQAAANKLKAEMEEFGIPPNFPVTEAPVVKEEKSTESKVEQKGKGKKSKAVAKTGSGVVRQWNILKQMVDESEIPQFSDPLKWLAYFPPYGKSDLQKFGACVDWRRSFITTAVNPYYDSFIRWQFRVLKEKGRVKFGKRPNVYSILDGQVCADHDRASGEGVNPQEYTLIKLRVLEPFPEKLSPLSGRNVFLAPATLRPETMYGQTNCFVLPEGDYGAFELGNGDIFIISERSAKGLAHQDFSAEWGKTVCLLKLKGWDLLGIPLKAPKATFPVVYTLPLLTISMSKGTGVVTSVPSDAPDDYVALRELKNKPEWRVQYKVTAEMVEPYEVVPIIEIPGYGDQAAVTVSERLKIRSPKDTELLKQAKEEVYTKGFYEGIMLVGTCKGMKVCNAKPVIKQEMIDAGEAITYYEPESLVMSRSGDECVVATTDQWYLTYQDEDWTARVYEHIRSPNFDAYSARTLAQFDHRVGWLGEWACSRMFGLGTLLPWDEKWVIESLSDSTIYMAYYTIAHLLQGEDNLDGKHKPSPAGIAPDQLTDQVWNYLFLKGPVPTDSNIPVETLNKLRQEFEYWYPLDLRVSAKDLIPNHLTMALFHHTEVWEKFPDKWPRSMFTNGHILRDGEKMSKQKGNFMTMEECVENFSADAMRIALADAGDALDDANFVDDTANAAILTLYIEEEWIKTILKEIQEGLLRDGPPEEFNFFDLLFANEMNKQVAATKANFSKMMMRDALHSGWFEFSLARDFYRDWSKLTGIPMHQKLILQYIEWQVIVVSPIAPHWTENLWEILGKEGSIVNARWPEDTVVDAVLLRTKSFLDRAIRSFRMFILKAKGLKKAYIYVAAEFPRWKVETREFLRGMWDNSTNGLQEDFMVKLKEWVMADPARKKQMKAIMQFASFTKEEIKDRGYDGLEVNMPFDQKEVFTTAMDYLKLSLDLEEVAVYNLSEPDVPGPKDKKDLSEPGKPSIFLY